MTGKCVIITGGNFSPIEKPDANDFVIACDLGLKYAQASGILPNLIIGDFDSYRGQIPSGIPVERFPSVKDDTDTMIAIRYAVSHGFKQISLFCALGGRLDHLYANLQAAAFAAQNGSVVTLKDENTVIYILCSGKICIPSQKGCSLSVFAFTDQCCGVSIHGTKYELEHASLNNSFPLGVSNEWKESEAVITVETGTLMIVLSKITD